MEKLSSDYLHSLFSYDSESGFLRWKVPAGRRRKAGDIAGCVATDRRVTVGINGQLYRAHRIIWCMMTGIWPEAQIDHIDRNPSNNRFENLRAASKGENMMNIGSRSNSASGYKGVSFHKAANKWRAYIGHEGKLVHLGLFLDIEDAKNAYNAAALKLHGEFACPN